MIPDAVSIPEALKRTGLTYGVLKRMIERGEIRWMPCGKRKVVHEEDVRALEPKWQGNAVNKQV